MTSMPDTTLVILAAGMSSRYGKMKQTDAVGPGGHALVEYTLYDAFAHGWRNFLFVVREETVALLKRFFTSRLPSEAQIDFAIQDMQDIPPGFTVPSHRKKPWGTAHAILATRKMIRGPFATINCDDYYGPQILGDMYKELQQTAPTQGRYFLAGYTLRTTLSAHGGVSRAICMADGTTLHKIKEYHQLHARGTKIFGQDAQGRQEEFTGNETVSMNLFGLTPPFFSDTWELFVQFLSEADEAKEFYIPEVLNTLITNKLATVTIIPSNAQWYGLTHAADYAVVQQQLQEKVDANAYPLELWK